MNSEPDDGPLPGGMSVRRARRHVPRRKSALPAVAIGVLVAAGAASDGNVPVAVIFALLAALGAWYVVKPPGAAVTARSQPDLWAAVAQIAASLDARPPRKVWLTHDVEVTVDARRRHYDIMIGLPLFACIDEHELRGLIAHELAQTTFARPDLVLPLVQTWRDVADTRSDEEAKPEDEQLERELRNVGLAVERAADAAAAHMAGSHAAAARAIAVVDGLEMTRLDFLFDLGLPRPSVLRPMTKGLEDVDDVWRQALRKGIPCWLWDDEIAVELAHKHPSLADCLLAIKETDLDLRLPRSPIRLRPLDRRSRRRLARGFLRIAPLAAVRWHTIDTAPATWWQDRAHRSTERVRADVATVLGREPVDHMEIAEVLLLRTDALVAVRRPVAPTRGSAEATRVDDGHKAEPEDGPDELPSILQDLVEDVLLHRGWRLESPVVRGVLIGPRGERVDAMTLVTGPRGAPNLEPLRRLLRQSSSDSDSGETTDLHHQRH